MDPYTMVLARIVTLYLSAEGPRNKVGQADSQPTGQGSERGTRPPSGDHGSFSRRLMEESQTTVSGARMRVTGEGLARKVQKIFLWSGRNSNQSVLR